MDTAQVQIKLWAHRLSEVNPNIMAVMLAALIIPIIFIVDSIGKNPPAVAAPMSNGKLVTVDSKGRVRTREVENKKDL